MKLLHDIGADKIKFFLSSQMNSPDMMVVRKALKNYFDRSEFYQLVCIDNTAGAVSPRGKYSSEIASSDAIIMILSEVYREAVRDEFELSLTYQKPLYVFIKDGQLDEEQQEFKSIIAKNSITYMNYRDVDDLINCIERTLCTEMLLNYKRNLSQRNRIRDGLL